MRKFMAGAALALIVGGAASTAGAAPKPKAETYTCDGATTTFTVVGRNGFIDGVHYQAHNLVVDGVFDPAAPGLPNETFHDEQWSSGRTGGLSCSATETFTDASGTTTVTITLDAIPTK